MTSTTEDESQVLKSDALGRVRTAPARRESLIQEFERSGLSGAKFAALVGVKYSTFAAWLQQRRRRGQTHGDRKATPEKTLRWLEAVVEEAQPAGGPSPSILLVELPGKARLQIRHPEQAVLVAALLRALEQPC